MVNSMLKKLNAWLMKCDEHNKTIEPQSPQPELGDTRIVERVYGDGRKVYTAEVYTIRGYALCSRYTPPYAWEHILPGGHETEPSAYSLLTRRKDPVGYEQQSLELAKWRIDRLLEDRLKTTVVSTN